MPPFGDAFVAGIVDAGPLRATDFVLGCAATGGVGLAPEHPSAIVIAIAVPAMRVITLFRMGSSI